MTTKATFFIPSFFFPYIFGLNADIISVHVQIHDKSWGRYVYDSVDAANPWDPLLFHHSVPRHITNTTTPPHFFAAKSTVSLWSVHHSFDPFHKKEKEKRDRLMLITRLSTFWYFEILILMMKSAQCHWSNKPGDPTSGYYIFPIWLSSTYWSAVADGLFVVLISFKSLVWITSKIFHGIHLFCVMVWSLSWPHILSSSYNYM